MPYAYAVVEDNLQEVVLRRLLLQYRPDIELCGVLGKRGNNYIQNGLRGFNEASKGVPFIVLTDLDHVACAPELLDDWIDFEPHPNFLFRIAEKEVDAWILADMTGVSTLFGVSMKGLPIDTQTIQDPKQTIINLARRSRKRKIKDIVPVGTASQGPGYNLVLTEFVLNDWDPGLAAKHNMSLHKAIHRIKEFLTDV